jgi:hypothetical protein
MTNALSLVNLSSNLDVSDVLSVVTSRAETRFHTELTEAKKRLREAEADAKRLDGEATSQYRTECQAAGEALARKLRPVITEAGGVVSIGKPEEWRAGRRERDEDGRLTCGVSISSQDQRSYQTTFTARVEPSAKLVALEAAVDAARNAVAEAQTIALEWRKKLANVPLLERRARAKLAEAKLSESADGQAVLDLLTDNLENELLALPGN